MNIYIYIYPIENKASISTNSAFGFTYEKQQPELKKGSLDFFIDSNMKPFIYEIREATVWKQPTVEIGTKFFIGIYL